MRVLKWPSTPLFTACSRSFEFGVNCCLCAPAFGANKIRLKVKTRLKRRMSPHLVNPASCMCLQKTGNNSEYPRITLQISTGINPEPRSADLYHLLCNRSRLHASTGASTGASLPRSGSTGLVNFSDNQTKDSKAGRWRGLFCAVLGQNQRNLSFHGPRWKLHFRTIQKVAELVGLAWRANGGPPLIYHSST